MTKAHRMTVSNKKNAAEISAIFQAAAEKAVAAGERGIQIAVYQDGRLVADVCAGIADPSTGRAVDKGTLFNIFSVTKAITNVALQIQADRGLIGYSEQVAHYWPEFGANGKDAITVEDVLSHRSGLMQMPDGVTPELMVDYAWMVRQLASMAPMYPPGTTNAYHAYNWGWLVSELVTRTDPKQRPFRQFVADEILDPLGINDFWLGIPQSELGRLAKLEGASSFSQMSPDAPYRKAIPEAVGTVPEVWMRRDVQQGLHPGAGAISKASSVARFWAMLAGEGELDGVRILSKKIANGLNVPRVDSGEVDLVLGKAAAVSRRGFWLAGTNAAVGSSPRLICHPGAGGSLGWADPDNRLAVAICHNRMGVAYDKALAEAMRLAFDVA